LPAQAQPSSTNCLISNSSNNQSYTAPVCRTTEACARFVYDRYSTMQDFYTTSHNSFATMRTPMATQSSCV